MTATWLPALAVILQSATSERPSALTLCELVRDPGRHHNQVVRVGATMASHPEAAFVYDKRCNNRDSWVWLEAGPDYVPRDELWRKAQIGSDERVRRVVVGRFEAPNGDGYGHLGGFRQQIVLMAEEDVRRAPRNEPAPDDKASAPSSDAEAQLKELDEKWFVASVRSDNSTLGDILSEDHVRLSPSGEVLHKAQVLAVPQLPHALAVRPGEDWRAFPLSWRLRVFVWSSETGVVIRNVERFKDKASAARSTDPMDEYEYVNFYRRTQGRWRLTFSRLTHTPKRE